MGVDVGSPVGVLGDAVGTAVGALGAVVGAVGTSVGDVVGAAVGADGANVGVLGACVGGAVGASVSVIVCLFSVPDRALPLTEPRFPKNMSVTVDGEPLEGAVQVTVESPAPQLDWQSLNEAPPVHATIGSVPHPESAPAEAYIAPPPHRSSGSVTVTVLPWEKVNGVATARTVSTAITPCPETVAAVVIKSGKLFDDIGPAHFARKGYAAVSAPRETASRAR